MLLKVMCGYCGDEESTINCNDCHLDICDQHSHECEACGENYCPNCIHKCEECEGYVCNACLVHCKTCDEHCLHEACAYKIGDDWYCEAHTQECSSCYDRQPTDNLVTCVKCEETVCEEHRVQVDTETMCLDCVEDMKDD